MCFPCQRTTNSFCFACRTDHHQAPSQPPVQAPATAVAASGPSLEAMPNTLTSHILGFTPGSAPAFGVASRGLHYIMGVFAQWNAKEIFRHYSQAHTLLERCILELKAHHEIALRRLHPPGNPSNGTGMSPDLSPYDFNCILSSLSMSVHFSIVQRIRALGVTCPNTVLAPQEVASFNVETQRLQDGNLEKVWSRMHPLFHGVAHPPADLPAIGALPQDIRTWMRAEANQARLQGISELDLSYLELTCLPEEIKQCTALQSLHLSDNRLVSLPAEVFRGLAALQGLYLSNNQLVSLPAEVFQGLAALQWLYLSNNQLVSLPAEVFQGLAALQWLHLSDNRLVSLPAEVFRGLAALQWLYLSNNQLVSLPAEVFQGLAALQWLHLSDNRLVSLPAEVFRGLAALQSLHLSDNQLVSLPAEVFQGLAALQGLTLYGNPRLLVAYKELPVANNRKFLNAFGEFFNYICQSPLARVYQLAAGANSLEAVRAPFDALPDTIKNDIYGKIWMEAGRPMGDSQWGEHHAFEDMGVFGGALKRHVREMFDKLDDTQKNVVYGHVYHLARRQSGAGSVDFSAPNWGERHASDNVLRMIDAMNELI